MTSSYFPDAPASPDEEENYSDVTGPEQVDQPKSEPDAKSVPAKPKAKRPAAKKKSTGPSAGDIDRAVRITAAVAESDEDTRDALAGLLNVDDSAVVPLSKSVVAASAGSLDLLRSVLSLSDTSVEEATDVAITAASADRSDLKALWATLTRLGLVEGRAPAGSGMARSIVKAGQNIDEETYSSLEGALSLLDQANEG